MSDTQDQPKVEFHNAGGIKGVRLPSCSFMHLGSARPGESLYEFRCWVDPAHVWHHWCRMHLWYRANPRRDGVISGGFSAVSDYGAYGYVWSDIGVSEGESQEKAFLDFLTSDPGYITRKLGQDRPRTYDAVATRAAIRQAILEWRRDGALTREGAREEWDRVEAIESEWQLGVWFEETSLVEPWEFTVYGYSGDLHAFVDRILMGSLKEAVEAFRGCTDG